MTNSFGKTLAVFYSRDAFGDCARHAILVALEHKNVQKIKIFSNSMETLNESNWKCRCNGVDHGAEIRESPYSYKIEKKEVDISDKNRWIQ